MKSITNFEMASYNTVCNKHFGFGFTDDFEGNIEKEYSKTDNRNNIDITEKWSQLKDVIGKSFETFAIERKIKELESVIKQLQPGTIIINSLDCYGLNVTKPIYLHLNVVDDDFYINWFDTGIATAGDSVQDAISNIKELISETYKMLLEFDDAELGLAMLQQKITLHSFLEQKDASH